MRHTAWGCLSQGLRPTAHTIPFAFCPGEPTSRKLSKGYARKTRLEHTTDTQTKRHTCTHVHCTHLSFLIIRCLVSTVGSTSDPDHKCHYLNHHSTSAQTRPELQTRTILGAHYARPGTGRSDMHPKKWHPTVRGIGNAPGGQGKQVSAGSDHRKLCACDTEGTCAVVHKLVTPGADRSPVEGHRGLARVSCCAFLNGFPWGPHNTSKTTK